MDSIPSYDGAAHDLRSVIENGLDSLPPLLVPNHLPPLKLLSVLDLDTAPNENLCHLGPVDPDGPSGRQVERCEPVARLDVEHARLDLAPSAERNVDRRLVDQTGDLDRPFERADGVLVQVERVVGLGRGGELVKEADIVARPVRVLGQDAGEGQVGEAAADKEERELVGQGRHEPGGRRRGGHVLVWGLGVMEWVKGPIKWSELAQKYAFSNACAVLTG